MIHKKIIPWVLVIVYMAVIFAFSSQPGTESMKNSGLLLTNIKKYVNNIGLQKSFSWINIHDQNYFFRKLLHATEYFTLSIFIYFALTICKVKKGKSILIASAISILYAFFDEYHQFFVIGRTSNIKDVTIDISGILCASFAIYIKEYFCGRSKKGKYE